MATAVGRAGKTSIRAEQRSIFSRHVCPGVGRWRSSRRRHRGCSGGRPDPGSLAARKKATVEATGASTVTIIADEKAVGAQIVVDLMAGGATVERISGTAAEVLAALTERVARK